MTISKDFITFDLKKLHPFQSIVIQCHDNPDADAIASGFGIYTYLKSIGKDSRLIYSGHLKVSKPNLLLLINSLNIPLEYVTALDKPDLLITVDCQVKGGNITFFDAFHFAEIDHHIETGPLLTLSAIHPEFGSCSTLVWALLDQASFDFNHYQDVATALYYGLLTDTNTLTEIRHPLDKEMSERLSYDTSLLRQLKHSNLSMFDLETAGIALIRCSTNKAHKFAVLEARPCDPNILGFISDLAIQVDNILVCIVYFEDTQGIKFSIRSCTDQVKANEFAHFLSQKIGSGGGHFDKAGGSISTIAFEKKYESTNIETYFHNMTREYFETHISTHTL